MGLGSVIAAIDELAEADPQTLGDGDTVVELHRQLARLEAVVTRASAAFDASPRSGRAPAPGWRPCG